MKDGCKKLSDEEAMALIRKIERRAGCGLPYRAEFDAFKDDFTVTELLTATLFGLGFDRAWVAGRFGELLEAALKEHHERLERLRDTQAVS